MQAVITVPMNEWHQVVADVARLKKALAELTPLLQRGAGGDFTDPLQSLVDLAIKTSHGGDPKPFFAAIDEEAARRGIERDIVLAEVKEALLHEA